MPWQAWAVVLAGVGALAAMVRGVPSEIALGVSLGALTLFSVVEPGEALSGFGNEQLHTVALLFVVAAALRASGSLRTLSSRFLKSASGPHAAVLRLTIPVALLSSVLNNTPIVAMLIPEVRDWGRRIGIPASRLLIPLSYAAIVGGLITVIGTSTNLVVNGLVTASGRQPVGFLEIAWVGVPLTLATLAFLTISARWLLPERPDVESAFSNSHTFTTEILVDRDGSYAGKRIAEIELADIGPIAPVEIERRGRVIPAPRADHVLESGDRLVFAGPVAAMLALKRHSGLTVAPDHAFQLEKAERQFAELLISPRCPLLGRRVGDGTFRSRYNAAVIAVARHGQRIDNARLGDWVLQAGDIVLVEVGGDFFGRGGTSVDFYLVTPRGPSQVHDAKHAWTGLVVLGCMVGAAATGLLSMFKAAAVAVGLLFAAGLLTRDRIAEGLDLRVLMTIAFSFGLGQALETSGAAGALAALAGAAGAGSPHIALITVYFATALLTEIITNNAAAALMVPVAFAISDQLGASHTPFAIAIMVAASASFMTPIGYTTNLMVFGPGGYRFTDFIRAGVGLALITALLTMILVPRFWPF
jgi:di/tricarboxylate transporter